MTDSTKATDQREAKQSAPSQIFSNCLSDLDYSYTYGRGLSSRTTRFKLPNILTVHHSRIVFLEHLQFLFVLLVLVLLAFCSMISFCVSLTLFGLSKGPDKVNTNVASTLKSRCFLLFWRLTTRQPLWVILCRPPEKGRMEIEEIVEEMKERDREERGTGMKVKKQKK